MQRPGFLGAVGANGVRRRPRATGWGGRSDPDRKRLERSVSLNFRQWMMVAGAAIIVVVAVVAFYLTQQSNKVTMRREAVASTDPSDVHAIQAGADGPQCVVTRG